MSWSRACKAVAVAAVLSVVGSMFVLPAVAHKGGHGSGKDNGGRGIATITSYDATTNQLVLDTKHFGVVTLTVAEDASIGVIQSGKGHRKNGFGHGTEADLVAGGTVMMSKVEEGLVTKLLVFLPKTEDCDDADDEAEEPGDEPTEDPAGEDPAADAVVRNEEHPEDEAPDEDDDDEDDSVGSEVSADSGDSTGSDCEEDVAPTT